MCAWSPEDACAASANSDFGKQLREILRTLKPARLLIEPSGAGHAADIVTNSPSRDAAGHWSSTAWSVWWTLSTRAGSCAPVSREWFANPIRRRSAHVEPDLADAVAQQAFHAIAASNTRRSDMSASATAATAAGGDAVVLSSGRLFCELRTPGRVAADRHGI